MDSGMRRRQFTAWFFALIAAAFVFTSGSALAQDGDKKIRVFLTYGGHKFEQNEFFAMFDAMDDISYTSAPMPQSGRLLTPNLKKDYDVLVMYDMVTSITEKQQQEFVALLHSGIGVVSLHHNLGAHMHWDEYPKILGGKFLRRPGRIDDKGWPRSQFFHDQEIPVQVADATHPIVDGITDFLIHDETYKGIFVKPDVNVLLTTDHPKGDRQIAWTTTYGKSPIFYLLLGHDSKAWKHPAYPKLVYNAIRWARKEAEPTE